MRGLALASVVLNVVIIMTGSTVRLTESGLGCPSWPRCTGDSLVPVPGAGSSTLHMVIEFGNRLVALPVFAVALACLLVALRLGGRRQLVLLASLQTVGIVTQAVVGAVSVYAKLDPVPVATHFLLSMGVLATAMALYVRASEGDAPPRATVPPNVRLLRRALAGTVFVLLLVGTLVTGSGPHAGDASAPRLPFSIEAVARVHSAAAWLTVALTVALLVALRSTNAPGTVRRRTYELLALELAQGAIGYIQYLAGIPEPLVAVHILGATLTWIATLRVLFAMRERGQAEATTTADADATPRRSVKELR
ncbi:MAG: heme A synthase [Streptosporangiales bacterium]|nr:heme A synthase [Streptosporangiales bacterium]